MSNQGYSFNQLKKLVNISQVLTAYGLHFKLKQRNHRLVGPCPLHAGDNPTAFNVDLRQGIWYCFTRCGGGDIVELIRHIENCGYFEASQHLQRLASIAPKPVHSCQYPRPFRPFHKKIPLNPRVDFLQHQKRISIETAAKYEVGCADHSQFLRGTVAVRLHDMLGNPLGYCGRLINPDEIIRKGKWRFPSNFPKSQILYNAHRAQSATDSSVVVVECPWAVLRISQAGIKKAVALLGTNLSSYQASWLSKFQSVILLLDGDAAGRKASGKIKKQLCSAMTIHIHHLPNDLEPEDLSDKDLARIINSYLLKKTTTG